MRYSPLAACHGVPGVPADQMMALLVGDVGAVSRLTHAHGSAQQQCPSAQAGPSKGLGHYPDSLNNGSSGYLSRYQVLAGL